MQVTAIARVLVLSGVWMATLFGLAPPARAELPFPSGRTAGEIVVADLPGHAHSRAELGCDRALESKGGRWTVVPLKGD